jgi:hypothetical protein
MGYNPPNKDGESSWKLLNTQFYYY